MFLSQDIFKMESIARRLLILFQVKLGSTYINIYFRRGNRIHTSKFRKYYPIARENSAPFPDTQFAFLLTLFINDFMDTLALTKSTEVKLAVWTPLGV